MNNLQKIRYYRGLSHVKFSKLTGYSKDYIFKVEKNKKYPSKKFIKKASEVLGFSEDQIYQGFKVDGN